jgi:hypothetical protein
VGDTFGRWLGRGSLALRRFRRPIVFLAGFGAVAGVGWAWFPESLYATADQPVRFSHKVHNGGDSGLSCADCHPFRADGSFGGVPPLEQCAGCHETVQGKTAEEKRFVDEYVTPRKEVPWLVYSRQPMNAYFSHVQHVRTARLACDTCHGPYGESDEPPPYRVNRISGYSQALAGPATEGQAVLPAEVMRMDTCAECHERSGRHSGCLECHK